MRAPAVPRIRPRSIRASQTPYGTVVADSGDYTPPAFLDAPGGIPAISAGPQYSPETSQFLQDAGMPLGPISSDYTPAPNGPFGIPGSSLDAAAQGFLSGQSMHPTNAVQNIVGGLFTGLAGGRATQAAARAQQNQLAQQAAMDQAKARQQLVSSHASEMAKYRWENSPMTLTDPTEIAALGGAVQPRAKVNAYRSSAGTQAAKPPGGTDTVHITAAANDPYRIAAKQAGIALPPGEFDFPIAKLSRDMPQDVDEGIDYPGLATMVDQGLLPPTLVTGRSTKFTFKLGSELKKLGTNVSQKVADFNATQAYLRSANSTTQLRFRQALKAVPALVDEISGLNAQLKDAGIKENRVPIFNRVQLGAIQGGIADTPAAQGLVTRYKTAALALVPELGFAEMGGTAPTDRAMERAVKQFQNAASFDAANSALLEIKRLATIRENTMNLAGAVAPSNSGGGAGYIYGMPPQAPAQEPMPGSLEATSAKINPLTGYPYGSVADSLKFKAMGGRK